MEFIKEYAGAFIVAACISWTLGCIGANEHVRSAADKVSEAKNKVKESGNGSLVWIAIVGVALYFTLKGGAV